MNDVIYENQSSSSSRAFPIIWGVRNSFVFLSSTLSRPLCPPPSAPYFIYLYYTSLSIWFSVSPPSLSWYWRICRSSRHVPSSLLLMSDLLCDLCHWCHFTDHLMSLHVHFSSYLCPLLHVSTSASSSHSPPVSFIGLSF